MTSDELARMLSEQAHAPAWEQRDEFIAETERQEAERAQREHQKRARKPAAKGDTT